MSLDRINNNKDYSKENCRWATQEEQHSNKRSNNFLTYKGETMTITQWAKKLNIHQRTLFNRIQRGWSIERALITKVNK